MHRTYKALRRIRIDHRRYPVSYWLSFVVFSLMCHISLGASMSFVAWPILGIFQTGDSAPEATLLSIIPVELEPKPPHIKHKSRKERYPTPPAKSGKEKRQGR